MSPLFIYIHFFHNIQVFNFTPIFSAIFQNICGLKQNVTNFHTYFKQPILCIITRCNIKPLKECIASLKHFFFNLCTHHLPENPGRPLPLPAPFLYSSTCRLCLPTPYADIFFLHPLQILSSWPSLLALSNPSANPLCTLSHPTPHTTQNTKNNKYTSTAHHITLQTYLILTANKQNFSLILKNSSPSTRGILVGLLKAIISTKTPQKISQLKMPHNKTYTTT